ncbi:matrixin family metalloprotease [Levilactobacillus namurensis]|uniref:matrixin family metalloprotease n=1 Tax=Levilactobacillus namurensis TaxID=380393 RepID=UPI0026F2EB39|nr:matrixin family metalloprotease [Levilactobacillus namurensis]
MRKGVWVKSLVIVVTTLGIFLSQVVTGTAAAASMTPFGQERFAHAHATYVITTKSAYYRGVWQSAIKAWNATGVFKFEKSHSRNAQIDLDTNRGQRAAAMGDDVGLTDYWARHYDMVAVLCALNPRLMHEFQYSRADEVHVAEHELGHAMGLDHNPSRRSVMYYENRSEGIQKVDVEGVYERYLTPAGEAS